MQIFIHRPLLTSSEAQISFSAPYSKKSSTCVFHLMWETKYCTHTAGGKILVLYILIIMILGTE